MAIILVGGTPAYAAPASGGNSKSSYVVAGPNLVSNPGFEGGLNGWTTSSGTGAFVVNRSAGESGCCSVEEVEISLLRHSRLYQDITKSVLPGGEYQIGGWIRTQSVQGNATLGVTFVGANGQPQSDGYVATAGVVSGTTNWSYYQSQAFRIPPIPLDAIAIWFYIGSGVGVTYFDDLSLVQLSSLPGYVVAAVPIAVSNVQSMATPAPFEQMIKLDSSLFSDYESPNLQNVGFFDSLGNVIPSWLESGNNALSRNTMYWLRLDDGIQARSTITIFMGFASRGVSLLNNRTTGEAPQLSNLYGEYDNGPAVFRTYDNFAGTRLSDLWSTNLAQSATPKDAAYTVGGGLSVAPMNGSQGYVVSRASFSTGFVFESLVTSIGSFDSVGFFNTTQPTPSGLAYVGSFIRVAGGYTFPDQWSPYFGGPSMGEANYRYGYAFVDESPPRGYITNSVGSVGLYSVSLISDKTSLQSINGSMGPSAQPFDANPPGYPLTAGFVAGVDPVKVHWARVRSLAPGNVMPSVVFGSISLSSTEIEIGDSVDASLVLPGVTNDAQGSVTYYNFVGGNCQGPAETVGVSLPVLKGKVPSSQPVRFNSPGTYSWKAVYSGDDKNAGVTTLCLQLSVHSSPLVSVAMSCNSPTLFVGTTTICKATIAGSGRFAPNQISWLSDGPGNFRGSTCSSLARVCTVRFTPTSAGNWLGVTSEIQTSSSEPAYTATFPINVSLRTPKIVVHCGSLNVPLHRRVTCGATVNGYLPTGSLTWSASGTGLVAFGSEVCHLKRGFCSVIITGLSAGSVTLSASYQGDGNNLSGISSVRASIK